VNGTAGRWNAYLDHLEVAVCEVEHALAAGETPSWSAPEPPNGTPPDSTLSRRDGLLVRMMVAAHTIEQLRDGVRAEIESLPAPRPRRALAYAGTIGTTFDYSG
jgi:hypothetical protein